MTPQPDQLDVIQGLRDAWNLHEPQNITRDGEVFRGKCPECSDDNGGPVWPCYTAMAIMDALKWPDSDHEGLSAWLDDAVDHAEMIRTVEEAIS